MKAPWSARIMPCPLPADARSRTGVSANRLDWCCHAGMFKSHVDRRDAQDLNQRRPQTTVWKEWVNDDACAIPASRHLLCNCLSANGFAVLASRHSCACHRNPYLKMSNRLCVISGNERSQEWTSSFATTARYLSRTSTEVTNGEKLCPPSSRLSAFTE